MLSGVIYSPALAQIESLNQSVSLNVSNTPLKDFLALIEDKAKISFAYNPRNIPLEALVTYSANNQPVEKVLDFVALKFSLRFEQIEKQIALLPNPDLPPLSFNLNGNVMDEQTGEQLIGATLRVDDINLGTITNGYGFYSISLPYGKHSLSISYLGYEIKNDSINLIANTRINLHLSISTPQLNEVIVQGYKPPKVALVQTGKISISPKSVAESPVAYGESDVIKSLERIPGIKLQSEGSTFFYVRAGNKDQNLILIDDAPIYNPSHLIGLYSTIIPETTNSIDVYKSDFPISKGGRLSSVIDIKAKEGNKNKISGWGNIGILSTQIGIEGPLKKGLNSFILSARISRIKWLAKLEAPSIEKFNFYDVSGKVNFELDKKNKLYFSFYTGSDKYLDKNDGLEWANFNGSIRWNKIINENTFVNSTLYASNYEYVFHTNRTINEFWRSRIGEIGLKTNFTTFIDTKQELNWGFNLTGRTINPGNLSSSRIIPDNLVVSVKNTIESDGHIQYLLKPSSKWGIKLGMRASIWTNFGEAFEFKFNDERLPIDTIEYKPGVAYHNYFQLEPRLSASYFINENASIKTSYDRTTQNLHLITNSISPFTSFEVWLPSGPNIKPQLADQFAVGYYQFLPNLGISIESEAYYKVMYNQIDYLSHASTLLNPIIESELVFGTTKTYGVEFFAKKETGRVRGMIGYTLSSAKSTFEYINEGNPFVANTDRPHHLSLNFNYDIALRVTLSSNFIYSSGIPFSTPTNFYLFDGNEIPIYGDKNNSRLPNYHRLDFSARFILNKNLSNKFRHSITVSVYNIYGRKNPIFINFNKSISQNGAFEVPTNLLAASRITSQRYIYGFAPSINYQFRF
ncbi:MAG: TonB-dependent receptor [Cyclobacteriaceae bacterium]|nr:TonB-dependent receptor [Cyclobacteriaceae bacterium]